ncbi:PTS glucitol/sorbitol transporter subunit IIA [Pediococcus argentinicus]|uniref:PTS system, glucitol sorbitol-specific IIA component n=1 Tax=Pediococcus argentinicus TaxID=480391 RepID=A0A0R2NG73_9LACO|nr:PTS glucitol/sorbitol transporter subunit IIA [Pediococcus argentinicus]KRO24806.1 PTS system, glucitol sorbitol-specific IIA component [Pediococcus argentinicus]NKZ22703.1 PTS glucitol/sorbitol transporter subunit IIA [Pediococcus argentinicus]GEP19719.1 PTS glucose transporter subunit IIABC [Pediococcus argentinicus]
MISSKIIEIGKQAISKSDPLAILFDESATDDLKQVAIIQQFDKQSNKQLDIKAGSQIEIGDNEYEVKAVGKLVNGNMQNIGHATLVFDKIPETPLASAIYLEPYTFPEFKVGASINYK